VALNDGFATDHQGRRIYFPPFGPARWVPSPDQEKAFKERVALWTTISLVASFVVLAILIFSIDTYNGALPGLVVFFGGRLLGAGVLARQWPPMDDERITYKRTLANDLLRRSMGRLCFLVTTNVLGVIFLIALPIWGLWFGPVDWSEKSIPEVMLRGCLGLALCTGAALYCLVQAHRLLGVLRLKLRRVDELPST
jgi:drug/metabolite transporter (DMT)-like permease